MEEIAIHLRILITQSGLSKPDFALFATARPSRDVAFFVEREKPNPTRASSRQPSTFHCIASEGWRRERDSNPRYLSVQWFSRPPQSTTLPSLRPSTLKPILGRSSMSMLRFTNFHKVGQSDSIRLGCQSIQNCLLIPNDNCRPPYPVG